MTKKPPQQERSGGRTASAATPTRSKSSTDAHEAGTISYPIRRRTPGRARSDASRLAILNATLKLLETQNLQQITIEAIAKKAEVGKATIYRWWSSKASIVIEAFVQNHIVQTSMPTGVPMWEALQQHLHSLVTQYSGWPGRVVAQILAEGQSDPLVLREFRERFFYGRRSVVREVLDEGRRRGEVRADLDADLVIDLLYASVYLRLMMQHLPLDSAYAKLLSETMLQVISPPQSAAAASPEALAKAHQGSPV